jgi:hypothetical protein
MFMHTCCMYNRALYIYKHMYEHALALEVAALTVFMVWPWVWLGQGSSLFGFWR